MLIYSKRKWVKQKFSGIYADFGSESEDDDWERKTIEKKWRN